MEDGQDFSATALYFERRARSATTDARRCQLLLTAQFYRQKARQPDRPMTRLPNSRKSAAELTRRKRLIELFRSYTPQPGVTERF
jgi:hypothetical protein